MMRALKEQKDLLRDSLKEKRRRISIRRRKEAEQEAMEQIIDFSRAYRYILTYASFGDEFSMKAINRFLEEEGKLLLPKVVGEKLRIYHVGDSSTQLRKNGMGIYEPVAALCKEVSLTQVPLILVPGLGFDTDNFRLGYGRGYYDRFLSLRSEHAAALGIGFLEQLVDDLLPREKTDVRLNDLLLF